MAIQAGNTNVFDKILDFFGKERGIVISTDFCEKHGLYIYEEERLENFWGALFRTNHCPQKV